MKTPSVLILILVSFVFFQGCASKQARQEDLNPVNPAAPVGPQPDPNFGPQPPAQAEGNVGPQPSPDFTPPKDGFVLVFGPGLARALAYIGVLRELEERHIAVSGVVGVEMGALISGIWASSNLNTLEWEMHKFKRQTLLDMPLFNLHAGMAQGKKLYKFLEESLKVEQLEKMRLPVVIASVSGGLLVEKSGTAKEIIRGAMGIPGILKPYEWDGKERVSAGFDTPFPVSQAKELGIGKILCVDVVGRGDNFSPKEPTEEHLAALMRAVSATARPLLKECDVVVTIPMDGVSYLGFDAKADLILRGRKAVQKWLEQPKG